ncbi:hypothetical protein [Flammeovirga aprica]|uniref:Uncharacterized protein n=1 Tax=Flammeovirga aprica JL-4 TaxID=694437 RepID=A0A7X9P3G0_9BACT|nr:hypothetical protein [Flammeovirga aprica]NME68332.1 hypothetical protein [Flammeovirga aprica JL-4]
MNIILFTSLVVMLIITSISHFSNRNHTLENIGHTSEICVSVVKSSLVVNFPLGLMSLGLFLIAVLKRIGLIAIPFSLRQLTYNTVDSFIIVGVLLPVIAMIIGIRASQKEA